MNNLMRRASLLGLTLLLLSGCAGHVTTTSYYSLYAPQAGAALNVQADGGLAVSVGPVTVPDILKQTRIATGGEGGRFDLAEYHRWSGEVDREMSRALAEQLSRRLGTENVSIFPWDQHFAPRFRVLADVLNMGGVLGSEANLSVRWAVLDAERNGEPVIRRSDLSERLTAPDHSAWVAAQQRNIEKLGGVIAETILSLSR
ncbi:hypothetical protein SAMN05421830_106198 [Desulfomicrobium norvegicum]|uniref:ABC-type transport auxiliary lipoprotein component domain-containing protein n=1 Tax=Desulfomicrobium norvegicum (strain DSM 1741 / NCIMB 8310) TaxID=52561 RepID=A0A8G2F682_DESNO|nr:PqiC family protein [Desulfomicrobium norvegicum]SFL79813.1 hypothetical protein SAMN05421830_106198 [Desulfomicrobium norvegicum]